MAEDYKGAVSQWNEGELKNLRLHKANEIINFAILNPLKKLSLFGGQIEGFGYELWFKGIQMLFGEGSEKYSSNEKKEIEKIRDEIETIIETQKISYESGNNSGARIIGVYNAPWVKLRKKLREFEYEVKRCNSMHGLSTRNKEEDDEDDY